MIDLSPLFGSPEADRLEPLTFRVFPKTGPERWLLETRYRRPWHLRTWPRANMRARLIYRSAWTMASFGLHLPSRVEHFSVATNSAYTQLRAEFDHLGIFLGTPGVNRKIVVYAGRSDRSVFVKIPLNAESAALVRNEAAALAELAGDPDLAASIPGHTFVDDRLMLEDVETAGVAYSDLELSEIARIHMLLARRSRFEMPLSRLRADWEAIPQETMKSTCKEIASARNAARDLLDGMDQDMAIACYMAHGDLTRWNALRAADGGARVIDWELYGPKPLYFDIIHYFVSHDLLVAKTATEQVLSHLAEIGRGLGSPSLWPRHVALYFAVQALHYTSRYARQEMLHMQAPWQLRAWSDILRQLDRSGRDPSPALAPER